MPKVLLAVVKVSMAPTAAAPPPVAVVVDGAVVAVPLALDGTYVFTNIFLTTFADHIRRRKVLKARPLRTQLRQPSPHPRMYQAKSTHLHKLRTKHSRLRRAPRALLLLTLLRPASLAPRVSASSAVLLRMASPPRPRSWSLTCRTT